ncbi:MAG: GntP family permease [bacterium]|nr:GntP family permease [bacterium]
MIDFQLIAAVVIGIGVLLALIIALKLNAFISLLISSIVVGVIAGMEFNAITDAISKGMGGTLGYVAVVVGLGAIFGAILEKSGGANGLAHFLISRFGDNNARAAVLIAGFIIAIPVFFDVAFIILIPVLHALSIRTGKSVIYFALPLLAGLAITHSLIPPTPGPVAVADIIDVDLGWVILFGAIVGIPVAVISGLWFSKWAASKVKSGEFVDTGEKQEFDTTIVPIILGIIAVPLFLIVRGTIVKMLHEPDTEFTLWEEIWIFLGHPFVSLIIATLLALFILGRIKKYSLKELFDISNKSLAPAGSIILITGAGGVFKQMLIETGAGDMIAQLFADSGSVYLIPLAFVIAALVRILQGSATVAMITAAGVIAPIMSELSFPDIHKALVVLSIAAGSVFLSHVNDSGFWLVNRYLDLSVQDTLKSWSALTMVIGLSSFIIIYLISLFV